jgi:hypothetical protein
VPDPGGSSLGRLSRRRFLRAAGAGGLGLAGLPLLGRSRAGFAEPATRGSVLFGAFSEPVAPEIGYIGSLEAFERAAGRTVKVYRSYRNWGQPLITPPIEHLLARTPPPRLYLSVHAFYGSKAQNVIPWSEIANGLHDAQIDAWSAELMRLTAATRVYLCFHHEMENEEGACGSPADFQDAYWYFRQRVAVTNGVPNLTWVVTYMGSTFRGMHGGPDVWWPGTPRYGLPADHLMGVDLYNRYLCHDKEWRSFGWLAAGPYAFAQQVGRPMFIGECGCVEGDACGGTLRHGVKKAHWFQGALGYMRDTAPALGYGPLEAFCYSNVLDGSGSSYRIDSSLRATSYFKTLATDPFFA